MTKPLRFATLKRTAGKMRNAPTQAGGGAAMVYNAPAPTLGLNTRNDYQELQPNEARELVNWLPDLGSCRVRPGYAAHVELASSTDVQGLAEYKGVASRKLIATADGEVHDATTLGSPTVLSSSASYASNRWRMQNFNNFLIAVNGEDTPWSYNGSFDSDAGFSGSGLTQSDLVSIWAARNRLWFCENNTADVWYGGIGAITGSLTKFQLSQIADGGFCMAGGAWSRDAGDGADDVTVFVMDTGQVIVYQGDPSSTFSLIGKYSIPEPVGRGCVLKVGGDLVIMTKQGPVPLSASFQGAAFDATALGDWGKIAPSWKDDFDTYGDGDAWTGLYANGIVYFSFPTSASSNASKQYVYNTRRAAWTTYAGLPASSWATLSGAVYIGEFSAGNVWQHRSGTDNGESIRARGRPGYAYPVSASRNIAINAIHPNIDVDGFVGGSFAIDIDFSDSSFGDTLRELSGNSNSTEWGDPWGSPWTTLRGPIRKWYGVRGYGRAVAAGLQVYSKAENTLWYSTDVMGVPGGLL